MRLVRTITKVSLLKLTFCLYVILLAYRAASISELPPQNLAVPIQSSSDRVLYKVTFCFLTFGNLHLFLLMFAYPWKHGLRLFYESGLTQLDEISTIVSCLAQSVTIWWWFVTWQHHNCTTIACSTDCVAQDFEGGLLTASSPKQVDTAITVTEPLLPDRPHRYREKEEHEDFPADKQRVLHVVYALAVLDEVNISAVTPSFHLSLQRIGLSSHLIRDIISDWSLSDLACLSRWALLWECFRHILVHPRQWVFIASLSP